VRAARIIRRILAGLLYGAAWLAAAADPSCRVAYDLGSSGIRAGASNSSRIVHVKLDALTLLSAPRQADAAIAPTAMALVALRRKGGFDPGCQHLGGGFSAWRRSLEQNPAALADALARIHAISGVAIVVIPQAREGAYGYQGARQLLGDRLATSHVLDIGGGSLQVSGKDASFGAALGQKLWHAELCRALDRPATGSPCALQPLTDDELATARALLAERLKNIGTSLPGEITMTSISRPVSRGVHPALRTLGASGVDAGGFRLSSLDEAIGKLHGLDTDGVTTLTGISQAHGSYLLSDLLLVEGLLQATGGVSIRVAEVDLTNVPGLLADDRTFAWGNKYGCYLDRLKSDGAAAYASDPASCD
jgi:hypothetical protein